MFRRFSDWPSRGERAIAMRARTPFAWGGHDCCLAACDVIEAIAGGDPAHWFRGRYRTAAGAVRQLRAYLGEHAGTYEMLLEPVAARLAAESGFAEVRPSFAGRLDVVLARTSRGSALGLVDFDGRSILVADDPGWSSLPMTAIARAWKIP